MKVKYLGTTGGSLTKGKTYDVISLEDGLYRIVDDTEEDYLFWPEEFEVVDTCGAVIEKKHPGYTAYMAECDALIKELVRRGESLYQVQSLEDYNDRKNDMQIQALQREFSQRLEELQKKYCASIDPNTGE